MSATGDYFWMLSTGIIEEHTRAVWRSFRDGYAANGADDRHRAKETLEGTLPVDRVLVSIAGGGDSNIPFHWSK